MSNKTKCAPIPLYSDLSKECKDLFNLGYHIGLFQVKVKNATCHGTEVKTTGTHKIEDKSGKGEVEMKAEYPMKGLTTLHKWDTEENTLTNEVSLEDFIPGAKIKGNFKANPEKEAPFVVGGGFKAEYKHKMFTVDAVADVGEESNVVVGASVVAGSKGLLGAYKVDYDTGSGELKSNNLGLAYQTKDYGLFVEVGNMEVVNAYYLHKVSREVDIGAQIKVGDSEKSGGGDNKEKDTQSTSSEGASGPVLSIAGRYQFNGYGHTLRAKINNQSKLGLGLECKVTQGFSAFASGEIDLKSFADGPHKIGFGLQFGM